MATRKDRRKDKRFSAPQGSFVFLRPDFANLGRVLDMSKGGLGLEYISDTGLGDGWAEVDIMLSDLGLHISRVPCRIVHDEPIDDWAAAFGLRTRRCGLLLGELTPDQTAMLDSLDQPLPGGAA